MIPARFTTNATLHICQFCNRVKKFSEWIEFTLTLQLKTQHCEFVKVTCLECKKQDEQLGVC